MEQATATATPEKEYIAWPDAIEYGGTIWRKATRNDGIEYGTIRDEIDLYIYQYPKKPEHYCSGGRWRWAAEFKDCVPEDDLPQCLRMDASGILDTHLDAMCQCINAFDEWLDDMQRMLLIFKPGDQYAQGFRAGQEDIKAKVAEVVL